MPLVQIRRRIGVAAALYAGLHFLIYVADQKWNLIVVALEIAKRFYLTIGFVALLSLAALAITSTNGWQRRLKRNWKRLHWLIYPAAVLAILHFFIQSKANVGEATVAAGLFAWLMIWRFMPAKLRTQYLGLLLLAVGATVAALLFEVGWYGLVNHVDPMRILRADINPDLVPRPTHKVLLAGLGVIVLVAARRLAVYRKTPLDEALYPEDYTDFLKGGLRMGLWMKRRAWLGLAVAIAFAPAAAFAQDGLVIFAAASLKNALDDIAAGWKDSGKPAPKISYAASSALAKQIEQGAPADLFISADLDWMDYVEKKDLIQKDTRVNLLGNKIVLIAPQGLQGHGRREAGLRPRQGARRRQARHGQRRFGAGRQVRQGGAREARRLGRREGQDRPGRERARGAAAGGARRGAARHRLLDRRRGRAERQDRRRPSPPIPIRRSSIRRR